MGKSGGVLIAGATGMLGREIAGALARRGAAIRAIVRPGQDTPEARRRLDELRSSGVELIEADLLRPETLPRACEGIETIISAVQGGREVVVDGQKNLIEAGERAGVARMIPSDFSVDLHKLDDDDHAWLALRREADRAFEGRSIRPTSVMIGGFMEVAVNPILGLVDWEARTFTYWGDGDQPCDFTSIPDAASYTAAAALDDGLAGADLRVAGDVLTMRELHALFEESAGHPLRARSAGSIEALRARIDAKKRADAADERAYAFDQYLWVMLGGKGKLDSLDNGRYPQVEPRSFRRFLASQPSTGGGTGALLS